MPPWPWSWPEPASALMPTTRSAHTAAHLPLLRRDLRQLALEIRKLLRDLWVLSTVLFNLLLEPLLTTVLHEAPRGRGGAGGDRQARVPPGGKRSRASGMEMNCCREKQQHEAAVRASRCTDGPTMHCGVLCGSRRSSPQIRLKFQHGAVQQGARCASSCWLQPQSRRRATRPRPGPCRPATAPPLAGLGGRPLAQAVTASGLAASPSQQQGSLSLLKSSSPGALLCLLHEESHEPTARVDMCTTTGPHRQQAPHKRRVQPRTAQFSPCTRATAGQHDIRQAGKGREGAIHRICP